MTEPPPRWSHAVVDTQEVKPLTLGQLDDPRPL